MRNYVIALYIRLSVEDFKTESLSIPNQKLILREKAMSLPEWDNSEILEFIDNGHTGTNFERPAVQELLTMVQAGKINCTPICIYSVTAPDNFDGMETFGKLFFSDIHTFEKELHSEIEKIAIMDELPINWTYPEIQPKLLEEARKRGFCPKRTK